MKGIYSDPTIGGIKNISARNSIDDAKLTALLGLAGQIFGASQKASGVHASRVSEAMRSLDGLGIKLEPNRRALAEILALALASEPPAAELKPGDKPLFRDRESDASHPERASYDIMQWLRELWREETAPDSPGLMRPVLRRVDPSADQAVSNWLRARPLPADIKLMTKRQMNDAQVAQLDREKMREGERIRGVLRRRRAGMKHPDVSC